MNRRGFFGALTGLAGGVYAAFTGKAKKDYYNQPVEVGEIICTASTIETVGEVSLITFTFHMDDKHVVTQEWRYTDFDPPQD